MTQKQIQEIAESFKCRSSKIGDIMTNGRGKDKLLGDTCTTYLKEWLNEKLFNRRKTFTSKYTDKGLKTEETGITLIALTGDYGFIRKNSEQFENEFITGTPDIIVKKHSLIIDNKSSWSLDTFPLWSDDLKDKSYDWQVNGYCGLTGMENGKVCFTLNNMSDDMMQRQLESFDWQIISKRKENEYMGIDEGATDKELFRFVNERIFTLDQFKVWHSAFFPSADINEFIEIPRDFRVKSYDVDVSQEKIDSIYERVIDCRQWIKTTLENKLNN